MALADQSAIARVNASIPDISAYVKRGGKLILSGGWNNALVPAGAVLDYYRNVEETIGIEDMRTGCAPLHGAGHDRVQWRPWHRHLRHAHRHATLGRARRVAERRAIASRVEHGKVVRTRPLCPYPQVATYRGSGSTDEAKNFVCK